MAIHDSNPERRNLTILALSIIVFYLAGGYFDENTIRLQVINVHFTKPESLKYIVWLMLVWFAYRYWLTNQGSWKTPYHKEISSMELPVYVNNYVSKRFGLGRDFSRSYFENRHWVNIAPQEMEKLVFRYRSKNDSGDTRGKTLEISTWSDKLILFYMTIRVCIKKPTLTGYFVPYLLFWMAIVLGIINAQ